MRDCYKKYWKDILILKMKNGLPQFALKESVSRKVADEVIPSARPVRFVWTVVDKLTFSIEFAVRGKQDEFEASCGWSESGKTNIAGLAWLHDAPFSSAAFEVADAAAMVQGLSESLGDKPRVFGWSFWKPTTSLESTAESHAAWKAEFIAEELRPVLDVEALQRVESAVGQAMVDLKRCAMPWFEKKLEWYQKQRK